MLDDSVGEIRQDCMPFARIAVAGGLLMELAMQRRIDTDLTALFIVNAAPTGDELLDAILQEVAAEPDQHPTAWWIGELSRRHEDLVEIMLARLVAAGILMEEEYRILWVFSSRAYPQVSGREEREA